jgi:hypothetical protein
MTAIIMLAIIAVTAIAFPRSITCSLLDIPYLMQGKQVRRTLASVLTCFEKETGRRKLTRKKISEGFV